MTIRWVNIILGVWLILAPFILDYAAGSAVANDVIIGILVVAVAAFAFRWPNSRWVNTVLGVWLIIAPFILTYATDQALWNDVILGVLVLLFSLIPSRRAPMVRLRRTEERPPTRV